MQLVLISNQALESADFLHYNLSFAIWMDILLNTVSLL